YKEFAKVVIASELKRCKGETTQERLLEFIEKWRGKEQHEDPRYFRTVQGALQRDSDYSLEPALNKA
ncbi:MAG: hypothetical protein KDD55_13725, partial [Bdellovibrionales bacterium]|nr:hypothetical protein [Bdellovibrionales bacterium]